MRVRTRLFETWSNRSPISRRRLAASPHTDAVLVGSPRLTALLLAAVVSMAALPAIGAPAASAPGEPRASASVDAAVAWLVDQQQADGGFELAGFPGFETSDAILALAAAGQSGTDWDEAEALAAVTAVTTTGGLDPLDGLDDWIDSVQGDAGASVSAKAAQAAKVVSLVTVPLGLDPTDVDPSGDTAGGVDLIAAIEAAAGTGDYAALASVFTARVYALWALAAAGEPVPAALVTAIEAAQQDDGGFSYTGDPTMPSLDVDVTSAAVTALAVAGEADGDVVAEALAFLARTQTWTGDWPGGFDDGNPNSTALGLLGPASVICDPDSGDWRSLADQRFLGQPFPSPAGALEARQAADGHIAGPGDAWGLNTFGTTQAIQGLMAADGVWPYQSDLDCTFQLPSDGRRLVNGHYLDLLSRLSDEAGAAFWVGQLNAGMSPAQVSRRLTGSSEYGRRVVDRLATDYLGRTATDAEAAAGSPLVTSGRRPDAAAALLGGAAYFEEQGNGVAADWVDAVYLDAVGRAADPAGTTWALGQLTAGRTRTQVARSLLGSTEGLQHMVEGFYQDLLRRPTDDAGRDFWVGEIRRGRSPEGLVMLITGSGEYVGLTRPQA